MSTSAPKTLEGLHPTLMKPRVEAVLADPEAQGLGLYVVSAFRSIEYQRILFERAVKKYGSEAKARKWVAPPGRSNHGPKVDGYGTAVDLGVPGYKAVSGQWPEEVEAKVNAICGRHGLRSPMEWEDWHFEPTPNFVPPMPPAPQPLEDDMPPINPQVVVDSMPCYEPGCPGWIELQADGAVRGEGEHTGDHVTDSYFSLRPEDRNNPDRRFVAISRRRDRQRGYTIYANDTPDGYSLPLGTA